MNPPQNAFYVVVGVMNYYCKAELTLSDQFNIDVAFEVQSASEAIFYFGSETCLPILLWK